MTNRTFSRLALFFAAFFVFLPTGVLAKDEWLQVRSKNFFLIGNASEKDIRKVATKLEQFRETFRQLFRTMNLTASVPTNVVVFKSDSAYRPFKPKRSDGKIDNFIAGYFQPGHDVNYITLSTEGTDAATYGTVFHEYVHFVIETNFGKSEVPSWFNEGLAEYYQTFEIEEDQKVKLGLPQVSHLNLLAESKLIPLTTFLNIDNRSLGANGNHSRSIFYAQAWAMIHYLIFTGKAESLDKFLSLTMANKPPQQAFREAFATDYLTMEKELRKYVGQSSFKYQSLTFKNKLTFDTEMKVAPLTEADSNAYLGDLLYHVNRYDDAEPFLRTALSLKPDSSIANTSLGMVKIRQRKYDEAKSFLEKAIAQDQQNHLAFFRYAELLSREGQDEFGYVSRIEASTASRIREMLKRAIALNPAFTESYELLAFVSLVNNEHLDEAAELLKKALKYQPGNARYAMRIAEIYLRQEKYKEAAAIAAKLASNADDDDVRNRAERLASEIRERENIRAQYEAMRKRSSDDSSRVAEERVTLRKKPGEEVPSDEQLTKANEAALLRSLNRSLRPLESGEARVLGNITKVECKGPSITFHIKTEKELLQLSSKDFQGLKLMTFVDDGGAEVGCNAALSDLTAVVAFRTLASAKPPIRGELVAVEFVPKSFRFIDLDSEPLPPTYVVEETTGSSNSSSSTRAPDNFEEQRRAMMMRAITENLRKPAAGEKRLLGFLDRIECTNKTVLYHMRTGEQLVRLSNSSPETLFIRGFVPEIKDLQFGCGMKSVDLPVVFIFRPGTDAKSKVAGDLISLEFVPRSFQLEN
ncbi:MAG TPA: tetratricopeptide repeat protein [Pyrinomonadaceae bacterium]